MNRWYLSLFLSKGTFLSSSLYAMRLQYLDILCQRTPKWVYGDTRRTGPDPQSQQLMTFLRSASSVKSPWTAGDFLSVHELPVMKLISFCSGCWLRLCALMCSCCFQSLLVSGPVCEILACWFLPSLGVSCDGHSDILRTQVLLTHRPLLKAHRKYFLPGTFQLTSLAF